MLPFIKLVHSITNEGITTTTDLTQYFIDANIVKVAEAKKNSITLNLFNPYNALDEIGFKRDDSSIIFYCSNEPIQLTDTPLMSATLDSIDYVTDNNGKSTVKIKSIDKTGLFLSKLLSISYTSDLNYSARDILISVVGHCQDDLDESDKITFTNVASTKHDGTAFDSGIAMAKVWKPLYEWLNELSTTENTGDDRDYIYYIDAENDLHWAYPNQNTSTSLSVATTSTATTIYVYDNAAFPTSGIIQIEAEQIYYTGLGTNTFTGCTRGFNNTTATAHDVNEDVVTQTVEIGKNGVYNISIGTNGEGDYNFLIFNTGKMPQGYDYLWYMVDPDDKGKVLKQKFYDWKSISLDMYNFEMAYSAWGNTDGSYPTPGGNPLSVGNTYTTSWGVTVASDSEFESAWEAELKRRGENKAISFFRLGRAHFSAVVSMEGNNNYYINTPININLDPQGLSKILRVKQIRHTINKDGWNTELSLETDPDSETETS
jgi:hypothetical protein